MSKIWACLIAGITLCAGFAIGIGVGIRVNPLTADYYLLNLGSVGEWVSGLGALGAVITAVWLADKQRRGDVEDLKISCVYSFPEGKEMNILVVASCGSRPSKPQHLRIASDHAKVFLHYPELLACGDQLPKMLNYAEEATLCLPLDIKKEIAEYVEAHCGGETESLRFEIMTTLGLFDLKVPDRLITR